MERRYKALKDIDTEIYNDHNQFLVSDYLSKNIRPLKYLQRWFFNIKEPIKKNVTEQKPAMKLKWVILSYNCKRLAM